MNVAVVYILPHIRLDRYLPVARRFADSYRAFNAGFEHKLFVVVNGAQPGPIHKQPFEGMDAEFLTHTNYGLDIGAYQMFAELYSDRFDLMVCFGTPVHCRKADWMDRIVECYGKFGPGLYGAYGFHHPKLHIRTTSFWLPPHLLNSYPYTVSDATRYSFEHGNESITQHALTLGYPVMRVTWTTCSSKEGWGHVPNEDALVLDQHTDRAGYT